MRENGRRDCCLRIGADFVTNAGEIKTIDTSYQFFACQYLKVQIRELSRHLRGARLARNTEYVHQARVASRRLRAALGIFSGCFPDARMKRWQKQIKKLTGRLGAARDADVQIEFLKGFISKIPPAAKGLRPGLRRVMLRVKQKRQRIQPKIVKVLDRIKKDGTILDMRGEVRRTERRLSRQNIDIRSPYVFEQARRHIEQRLEELQSCQKCLENPDDKAGHHQMRIAAKKLRYVLEICNAPMERRLSANIEIMKRLQSLLGKVHDCDVWLVDLAKFTDKEKKRTVKYFGSERAFGRLRPGIEYLAGHRHADRELYFEKSRTLWKEITEAQLPAHLRAMIQTPSSRSQRAPAADKKPA
jgi:CHAD domain-containing protein